MFVKVSFRMSRRLTLPSFRSLRGWRACDIEDVTSEDAALLRKSTLPMVEPVRAVVLSARSGHSVC